MKVKELIEALQKHDPEKPVFIHQGEEYDYMTAYGVRIADIVVDEGDRDIELDAIVIDYC